MAWLSRADLARFFRTTPIVARTEAAKVGQIRERAHAFAELILALTPPSADQSEAIRNVRAASLWAEQAITRPREPKRDDA